MQYYWLIVNRTFEVFVTSTMICGARVRGVIASPEGTEPQHSDPRQYVSPRLRRRYDSVDVEAPKFLGIDRANFQLQRASISAIEYFPKKWGMGAVPYSGRLVLSSVDFKCELILMGSQDAELITTRLREAVA
jgi:hypothetical protein